MADSKTVLILGDGIGGVAIARALRKRLPTAHRILLVDREREHVFAPSLPWLMVGQRTAAAISRPDQRLVTVGGEALPADYLVIAMGAALAPELIPGLAQAGHSFYSRSGAQSLWTALRNTPISKRTSRTAVGRAP
jgi:sulfide:quinone oxidoreductase